MNLEALLKHPFEYENPELQDLALEKMPFHELFSTAELSLVSDQNGYGLEDYLVQAFLTWFKGWFVWVNCLPCTKCKNTETVNAGTVRPTQQDLEFGAQVVELHHCRKCKTSMRFPRYNALIKLLETHSGRCGEWCHAAGLFVRALGVDTRYIWNSEDHVWLEVFSNTKKRWIHIDACEAAFDHPLIYTDGWGKKMAYVLAFSIGGASDVTRRYVRRPEMQLKRQLCSERDLYESLATLREFCRSSWSPERQVEWFQRDEDEQDEFKGYIPDIASEPARQSGSAEWVSSRGEDGK